MTGGLDEQAGFGSQGFPVGKFGNRVNFNKTERILYGHDVAAVPNLIKPLIGDTIPEALVQPRSEEELVELVRWAGKNTLPLMMPRIMDSLMPHMMGEVVPLVTQSMINYLQGKRT